MWAFFVGDFMAIQTINLAVPGGDTPRSANTKINANFSDQTNAASKLVGDTDGKIPTWNQTLAVRGALRAGTSGNMPQYPTDASFDIAENSVTGYKYFWDRNNVSSWGDLTTDPYITGCQVFGYQTSRLQIGFDFLGKGNLLLRTANSVGKFSGANNGWVKVYTTGNTTKDAGTGFLKVSSPVLHVYNDKIDKIHEAEQLDITVDKKGVGHYEIHGTTGLRQNDGWNMSPPRDIHGNVRCMIEVTEKDDVITVKTYKRKFDLDLAAIVHDYDNPLDIPDGACVELRFNDLPQDDIQTNNP